MELTSAQAVFVLLGLAGVLIVFMVFVAKGFDTGRKVKALLDKQAGKRDGKVIPSKTRAVGPSLVFPFRDIEISVGIMNGVRTKYSCLPGSMSIRARLPKKNGAQFHIFKEEALERIEKVFGSQDIQLRDDAFDREFMVKSNNEGFLRSVLTPGVQQHILSSAGYRPIIEFNDGHFLLSVFHVVDNEEELENLIGTVISIVERLKEVG